MVDFARIKRVVRSEATWVLEDEAVPDGPAFLLAPFWSRAYIRRRDELMSTPKYKPLQDEARRQQRAANLLTGTVAVLPVAQQKALDDLQEELDVELVVDTVLFDWRGQTEDGREVPYSKEVARENLQYPLFRDIIATLAPPVRHEVDAEKNSVTASDGH